jgi:hypothetical protein
VGDTMIAALCAGATGLLALAGLWSLRCAGAAVLTAAVALLLCGAGIGACLLGGLAATGYLVVAGADRSARRFGQWRAGAAGAALFGSIAAGVCAWSVHLAWAPIALPVAALVAAVVPLRAMRPAASR